MTKEIEEECKDKALDQDLKPHCPSTGKKRFHVNLMRNIYFNKSATCKTEKSNEIQELEAQILAISTIHKYDTRK